MSEICKCCGSVKIVQLRRRSGKSPSYRNVCTKCSNKRSNEYRRTNKVKDDPVKKRSRKIVENAIKSGVLVKGCCEVCGSSINIEAHHEDYSQPLHVAWLCSKHHSELHRKQKVNVIVE